MHRKWFRSGIRRVRREPLFNPLRVYAVLFDLDGTLADTDDVMIERAMGRLGPAKRLFPRQNPRPFLRWALMKAEGPANFMWTVPDRLHIDEPINRLVEQLRGNRPRRAPNLGMITGVDGMLATLCQHYPLAVVSTRDRFVTDAFLEQHGLRQYFQAVVTANDSARLKPHPAPVRLAAKKLGVRVRHCLMVGDTTMDVLAGKRAGAQTAGVLCGFGERPELERAGANLILETTPEVVGYL